MSSEQDFALQKYVPDEEDRLLGALSYVGTLFMGAGLLVPAYILLTDKKEKPALKFHAFQSLVTHIIAILCSTVLVSVLGTILSFTGIGCLFTPILLLIPSICIIINIYWGYKVYKGEPFAIPHVTEFVEKQVNK